MTNPTLTVEIGRLSGWELGTVGKSELGTTTTLATYTYTDITSRVTNLSIRRGRQHELDRVEAGTASVELMNQDGAFNPTNTSSVYYPDIRPMVPLRIRARFDSFPSVAGLAARYDFSDSTSLWQDTARTSPITADGQAVKGVTDKSGNGNHLSEATNGPTYKTAIQNGLSIARFDGTNDVLAATDAASIELNTDSTVFIVAKVTTNSIETTYLSKSDTTNPAAYYFFNDGTGKPVIDRPFIEAGVAATNAVGTTLFRIVIAKVSGTAVSHFLEGVANGTDTLATGTATNTSLLVGQFTAGTPRFYSGDIGEIDIFNAALTSADMNLVGQYLADKWGKTWTTIP